MKSSAIALTVIASAFVLSPASAQERIYRCGNEYTNNAQLAKERGCKVVEGGNITIVPSAKPTPPAAASSASPANAPKVSATDQKARDSDARAILESELRKAEAKLAELRAEYNDGAPQRNALDLRNPQVYMERTADLKAKIERAQADVEGIRREIDRLK